MADNKKKSEKQGTYGDIQDSVRGNIPKTGTQGGLGGAATLYDQNGNIISNGDITRDNAATRSTTPDLTDPNRRIGDYVFVNNKPVVVPGSLTDYYQKYLVMQGANKKQSLNFKDWMSAIGTGVAAGFGAPTDSSNLASMIGSWGVNSTASALGKAVPQLPILNAVANTLRTVQDTDKRYLDDWLNQNVTYDFAFDIKKNDDGSRYIVVDYDKMDDAGYGSGTAVRDANNLDNSSVTSDGSGGLNINVTNMFAKSDRYQEIVEKLQDEFRGGLDEDDLNQVVDEETGWTRLQVINDYIKGEEERFWYNATSTAELKKIAPGASDEAIEQALDTQIIGSLSKKNLESAVKDGFKVTIYDENNNKVEVNPQEYLDKISSMDSHARNDYMVKIGDRIKSDKISDDEKVILKAQANALYAASNNDDSGYGGMYKKGWWDSIGDISGVFTGNRFGDLLLGKAMWGEELTAFEDDEIASGLTELASTVARLYTMRKVMGGFGKLSAKGIGKAGEFLGGKGGEAAAQWAQGWLSNGEDTSLISMLNRASSEGYADRGELLADAGKAFLGLSREVMADTMYETLKAGGHALSGKEFDFWNEMSTDIVLDLIMQNGPSELVSKMEAPKYEYRRQGDRKSRLAGNDNERLAEDYAKAQERARTEGEKDEFYTGDSYEYGDGDYYGLVEVTAKQLSQRRADQIDKLTNNKIARKVGEMFFDKNFAMYKLALKQLAVTGDNLQFRRMVLLSGNLKAVTQDVINRLYLNEDYNKAYQEFNKALREAAPNVKNLSEADIHYMNAKANHERFSKENAGDKKVQKIIDEKYNGFINGVSKERAAQLDKVMDTMRKLYARTFEFYRDQGLITQEEYDRVTKSKAYVGERYFPVWTEETEFNFGGDIKQGRNALKGIKDKTDLIDVERFLNPLDTFVKYQYAMARNIAINERAIAIRDAAATAGIDVRITSDDGGALGEFENLKEYDKDFRKIYDQLKVDVDNEVPTFEEWQRSNVDLVNDSTAMKNVNKLGELQNKMAELQRKLRSLETRATSPSGRKNSEDIKDELEVVDELVKRVDEIAKVKEEIEKNKADQMRVLNNIVRNTVTLLKKSQKNNKYLMMKLDVETYVKTKIQAQLKDAVKAGNSVGAIQNILNEAINEASPYVSREDVLRMKATDAAGEYRKFISDDLKKKYANDKSMSGKVNRMADRIMDRLSRGIEKTFDAPVTEDSTISQILGNYSSPDEIRYLVDGKMYTMKLTGPGAEMLVDEFYNGEKIKTPSNVAGKALRLGGKVSGAIAMTKRALTTAVDVARVLPNLVRDWTRGVITTGGNILMSPTKLESYGASLEGLSGEDRARVEAAFKDAASRAVEGTTLTESLAAPKAREGADLVRVAQMEGANSVFTRYRADIRGKGAWGTIKSLATFLQDSAENYTRKRIAETAYNKQLADSIAEGKSVDEAIQDAVTAAAFYGREGTTNFSRRGTLIAKMARNVPYLSQKFGSLVSLANTYLDNPIAVARMMQSTVSTYSALIAIALSNEESREKYFLLSEDDRANNIIIPLDNDTIITLPLDDNVAAFLTPYRRMIESVNGLDPEAFYMWGKDFLEALSPIDIDGFSEGDRFNVQRGFQKFGAEFIPTWALPLIENLFGTDFYYGSDIEVTEKEAAEYYDVPNPTAGVLTTSTKNSKLLADIANATGIPQWQLQTIYKSYFGNVGQYVLYTINKASGAPEKYQGGKDWINSVFRPFTGADSDAASSALWDGINLLKDDKKQLRKELADIKKKLVTATGEDRLKLQKQRQEKISSYGTHVSDFVNQYLNAYEITGGLSKADRSRIWHLYDIWEGESEDGLDVSSDDSIEEYYSKKYKDSIKDKTNNLAASSGFDKYAGTNIGDYYSSYGEEAFKNSVYGRGYTIMAKIADKVEDTSDYANSLRKAKTDLNDALSEAYKTKDYDLADKLMVDYDYKVLQKVYPVIQEYGVEDALDEYAVMKYLKDWIRVPYEYRRTAKGRYVPKLKEGAQTEEAFKKPFIKYLFGISEE